MFEWFEDLKFNIADLIRFPRCFIFGHRFVDSPNACERCEYIFCRHSWTGFELKEKYSRWKTRTHKPPF